MVDSIKLDNGLKRIRKIRLIVFGLFIGSLPFWLCLVILRDITRLDPLYLLIPYGLILFIFANYTGFVRCPCCNEFFFWNLSTSYRNPFTSKCLTCGLHLNDKKCP